MAPLWYMLEKLPADANDTWPARAYRTQRVVMHGMWGPDKRGEQPVTADTLEALLCPKLRVVLLKLNKGAEAPGDRSRNLVTVGTPEIARRVAIPKPQRQGKLEPRPH
jgi:hypothetical protein